MGKPFEYIGSDKPEGWLKQEQDRFLHDLGFDEDFFEWLKLQRFINEIERERKERDTQRNS